MGGFCIMILHRQPPLLILYFPVHITLGYECTLAIFSLHLGLGVEYKVQCNPTREGDHMSPAPRRGRAKQAEPADAPKTRRGRGRAAKPQEPEAEATNGSGDADEATPVARAKYTPEQRLEMGQQIAELREDGTPWLEIAEELGLSGGVPARQMMNEYLASTDPDFALDPDADDFADTILELRDSGTGWGELQARSGLSKSELIEVYTEAGGEMAEGRVYSNAKSGNVTHKLGSTREDTNGTDEDAPEDSEEQEAPAPRRGRGRRAQAQPTEEQPAPARGRSRRRTAAK